MINKHPGSDDLESLTIAALKSISWAADGVGRHEYRPLNLIIPRAALQPDATLKFLAMPFLEKIDPGDLEPRQASIAPPTIKPGSKPD